MVPPAGVAPRCARWASTRAIRNWAPPSTSALAAAPAPTCARGTPSASRSSPPRKPAPRRLSRRRRERAAHRPSGLTSTLTSHPRLSRNARLLSLGRSWARRPRRRFLLPAQLPAQAQPLPDRPFPSSFDADSSFSRSFPSPSPRFGPPHQAPPLPAPRERPFRGSPAVSIPQCPRTAGLPFLPSHPACSEGYL